MSRSCYSLFMEGRELFLGLPGGQILQKDGVLQAGFEPRCWQGQSVLFLRISQ